MPASNPQLPAMLVNSCWVMHTRPTTQGLKHAPVKRGGEIVALRDHLPLCSAAKRPNLSGAQGSSSAASSSTPPTPTMQQAPAQGQGDQEEGAETTASDEQGGDGTSEDDQSSGAGDEQPDYSCGFGRRQPRVGHRQQQRSYHAPRQGRAGFLAGVPDVPCEMDARFNMLQNWARTPDRD